MGDWETLVNVTLQRYEFDLINHFWELKPFHCLLNACASTNTIATNELMGRKIAEQSQ